MAVRASRRRTSGRTIARRLRRSSPTASSAAARASAVRPTDSSSSDRSLSSQLELVGAQFPEARLGQVEVAQRARHVAAHPRTQPRFSRTTASDRSSPRSAHSSLGLVEVGLGQGELVAVAVHDPAG